MKITFLRKKAQKIHTGATPSETEILEPKI